MKQYEQIFSTAIETIDSHLVGRAAAAAAVAIAAVNIQGQPAYGHENVGSVATPSPAVTPTPRPPLPSNWPTSATLGQKDCRWGAPVDHQMPLQLATETAAMVDTRCEPPQNQKFAYVRSSPDTRAKAIGRVYNGQFVRLDCQIEGRPVGDSRGSFKNPQWFSITFRNRDEAQRDDYGYISGANLGQIDTTGIDIPPCD